MHRGDHPETLIKECYFPSILSFHVNYYIKIDNNNSDLITGRMFESKISKDLS